MSLSRTFVRHHASPAYISHLIGNYTIIPFGIQNLSREHRLRPPQQDDLDLSPPVCAQLRQLSLALHAVHISGQVPLPTLNTLPMTCAWTSCFFEMLYNINISRKALVVISPPDRHSWWLEKSPVDTLMVIRDAASSKHEYS
ncbi:hypothetical protein Hypma_008884 [Hypsizygus marmoreus]|uniref:Uncharacterized protein n=1 Tax=Hypsizygus marmoreus TaxID=39966 RepID=A0A369JV63_HYPMA|nr:hypothetical protein Hypma_008889 [Hypsizygus marmoreus]RDB23563.1 hypothetical protein Hypma_008884 [Hypsizygus marmoreus]